MQMQMKSLSVKSLSGAVLLGLAMLAANPGFAADGNLKSADAIKAMDTNRDGKLTKDEYLAAMGKVFDKHAGTKGYCTPDEAAKVIQGITSYPNY
jgi:hypothetical protein